MKIFQLSILCLIFLFWISCKKTNVDECGNILFTPLSFNKDCVPVIVDEKNEDHFFVVNSLAELKAILSFHAKGENECNSQMESIDFNKYTLIIGKKKSAYQNPTLIDQAVSKDCENNIITYTANLSDGGFTALDHYVFAVLIDKIPEQVTMQFNIKLQSRN